MKRMRHGRPYLLLEDIVGFYGSNEVATVFGAQKDGWQVIVKSKVGKFFKLLRKLKILENDLT